MVVKDILILGAGPCGLATAIALSRANSAPSSNAQPLRITLVELRSSIQTIGGAVNVTPLAMRYLNSLGAEGKLLDHSISLDHGIDYISLRTGQLLGNFWGGIGARRVSRYALVEALLAVLQKEHSEAVEIQWGRRVTEICETADKVELKFQDDGPTLQGDILLGCDGLHSAARRLWVEPEREKVYSGRVVTMGWNYADGEGDSNLPQPMTLSTGEPALVDTSLFSGPSGVILASYYESSRRNVYLSCVMSMDEPETADQNAWKMLGDDKETMRNEILKLYQDTKVKGLDTMISKCESWDLFPIYILPKEGRWHEGRVLLLGDAAHAVSRNLAAMKQKRKEGRKLILLRCRHKGRVPNLRSRTGCSLQKCWKGVLLDQLTNCLPTMSLYANPSSLSTTSMPFGRWTWASRKGKGLAWSLWNG